MHTIKLTSEEQQALVDILECCVKDLRSQIVHTDRYTYKQMLKDRKQLVQNILSSLQRPGAVA
ncbi:MAG: hypothetical protein JXA78_05410 [Anaerolineales bacterium]|nr:hypothetical protein [Anaerolineales bacterium]